MNLKITDCRWVLVFYKSLTELVFPIFNGGSWTETSSRFGDMSKLEWGYQDEEPDQLAAITVNEPFKFHGTRLFENPSDM